MPPTSAMQLDNSANKNAGDKTVPSPSTPSSPPSHLNNKNRKVRKSRRSVQHSLSMNSLPTCSSTAGLFLGSSEHLTSPEATARVFEALSKFQSCLFLLSNTVVRLQESLKLILPFGSHLGSERRGCELPSANLTEAMVKTSICPIFGKLVQSQFENNNCNNMTSSSSENEKKKPDTVLNVPSRPDKTGCFKKSTEGGKKAPRAKSGELYQKYASRIFKYVGIILSLFTSVCISLVSLVVKLMDGYHPVSKVVWRLQGVLLPSMIILLYVKYFQKKPLIVWDKNGGDSGLQRTTHWKWHLLFLLVLRGVIGCSADIFQYYSLKSLPLADSTVISNSTPIFVCIVAHFILREKCGLVPIFTAVLTLCGVIVICKPPILTGAENISNTIVIGNILAALCMICNTLATVIMRYLQHVHVAVTMLALGIFGTIEGLIVTLFTSPLELPVKNSNMEWMLAALIAGLFFFGQLSMTLALQHEEARVVSLVRTCDVLFAFIWQVNFLHQDANLFSYIGAVIVTLGVIITAIRRWVGDLPESCPIRNRLYFILR